MNARDVRDRETRAMGLFSFLFGKKANTAKAAKADEPSAVEAKLAPTAMAVEPELTPVVSAVASGPVATMSPVGPAPVGVEQVKLRLRLAASLRKGEHQAAYEAACSLADIQVRAGRRVSARVWTVEADRILEQMAG